MFQSRLDQSLQVKEKQNSLVSPAQLTDI